MIKIVIFTQNDKISGFQIKGHSGYADAGYDIVCSAVSVASQMCLAQLQQVLDLKVESVVDDGFMSLRCADFEKSQPALKALQLTLENIAENYPKFVKMEVRKDVS